MDSSTLERKKICAMLIIGVLLLLIYGKNLIERQAFNRDYALGLEKYR